MAKVIFIRSLKSRLGTPLVENSGWQTHPVAATTRLR